MTGRRLVIVWYALLAACGEESDQPYLTVAGGGFIFNYRIAESYYGIVVKVERQLPGGAVLVAEFQDPAGGPPITLQEPAVTGRQRYSFRSPPLQGIRKDVPYTATVTLRAGDEVLARVGRAFRSQVDQSIMPEKAAGARPGIPDQPRKRYHQADGATLSPGPSRSSYGQAKRRARASHPPPQVCGQRRRRQRSCGRRRCRAAVLD